MKQAEAAAVSLIEFTEASRPDLVLACQRLRYEVYRRDLGLDTEDMDHARGLDIEEGDSACHFIAAQRAEDGAIVGCLRAQTSGDRPFYAERDFVFQGPWWRERTLAEGARFAVQEAHRNSKVPLLLWSGFRAFCRARGAGHLISVSIVPDPEPRPETALAVLGWLRDHVAFDLGRARPAPGYEIALDLSPGRGALPAAAIDPSELPPMIRMLANRRSTLCSVPAYCRRFRAWSFLFITRIERGPAEA
jgi:putative hemolysin